MKHGICENYHFANKGKQLPKELTNSLPNKNHLLIFSSVTWSVYTFCKCSKINSSINTTSTSSRLISIVTVGNVRAQ